MNVSEIGRRVATLRRRRGLSLSKLAEIAGISKSTLSALESGKINPTISTLWSIANALNVPFGELIPDVVEVDESGMTVRLIERSIGRPKIEVYKMILKQGCVRKAEAHQRGVVEKITVVSGSMISGPIQSPKFLKAGDEFEFRADIPHIYVAIEETKAILTIRYPDEDFRYDLITSFPKSDVEIKSLIDRIENFGGSAFRIELHGDYCKEDLARLKDALSKLKVKTWIAKQSDCVSIYVFNTPIRIRIPENVNGEALKVLRLLKRGRLSEKELGYLQNLVDGSSLLLSVLASEALLAHGHPRVPEIGLENPKVLRPGYALQALFVASAVRRFVGGNVDATILGDETHKVMLNELLRIDEGSNVLISFDSNLDVLQNAEEYEFLIVCGDFVSPYSDRLESFGNTVLHHSRLMVETLVDAESADRSIELLSTKVPLIAYLAMTGEFEAAISQAFILHKELGEIEIRDPMESYCLFQRLELSEIIKGSKPYPEIFKSIAENSGFSLLYHERILATDGREGGIHILAFRREGWDVQERA